MDTQVYNTEVESDGERRPTAGDLFLVNLYAAVHCLLEYVNELSRVGGDELKVFFSRYPFLLAYKEQIDRYCGATDWRCGIVDVWREKIESLERDCFPATPLSRLNADMGVPFSARMALMLAGLVEEDSRFGTVFADLQQPLNHRRPMLETLGNVVLDRMSSAEINPFDILEPLVSSGLLEVEDRQRPRAEWIAHPAPAIWDLLRGRRLSPEYRGSHYQDADASQRIDDLIVTDALREQLRSLHAMLNSERIKVVVLRAMPGSHTAAVAGAIAGALGKGTLTLNPEAINDERNRRQSAALCTLLDAIPVLVHDLSPGETVRLPSFGGYNGPIIALLGKVGGVEVEGDKTVTLNVDMPDAEQRLQMWLQALNGLPVEDPSEVARRFRMPGGYIQHIAGIAANNARLDKRESVTVADVREAARTLNRQKLDSLAEYLPAKGSWAQLIAVDATEHRLSDLERRCYYRERLLTHLGSAFNGNANTGVRALFTGRSGTGKTLAAKMLAAELGMDIYRVDLAAVINKYIGETEKNLHQVLSHAEALDVILLLDEGDALLGTRTDVKSANDRYANLETNYLLQRLEHYQGIVLITTNLSENVDKAFQRRMDIVVPFYPPQAEERLRIFQIHLPSTHQVSDSYLHQVCVYCTLTGGQIRNTALQSTMLAMDEGREPADRHIELALRGEYRKAGSAFPLDRGAARTPAQDGGLGAMLDALAD